MTIDKYVDNPVVPAELGLLLALRLDPARWEVIGVSVDQEVLGTFSDSDPDSPVFDFTTDSVHAIDLVMSGPFEEPDEYFLRRQKAAFGHSMEC